MFKGRIVVIAVFALFVSNFHLLAQQRGREEELRRADRKIEEYREKRNTGIYLFAAGAAACVLGTAVFTPWTEYRWRYDPVLGWWWEPTHHGNAAIYWVLVLGGTVACIVGGYMWWDGSEGIRLWENRRMDLSMRISPQRTLAYNTIGADLVLRFR